MSKLLLTIGWVTAVSAIQATEWTRLPSLPNSRGVAGSFAGVSNGALIVAGGTNFPNKPPEEGGVKVWYDDVYVLERPTAEWRAVGKLPRPLGYGISATFENCVVCVGGSDKNRHYADAFRLEWKNGGISTSVLPSLPRPIANACGGMVGSKLLIAGGIEGPDSTHALTSVWCLDLSADEPKWTTVDSLPGSGRILPVAAANEKTFWVFGGAELVAGVDGKAHRHYLRDAYRYDIGSGWKRIADATHAIVAAPSPAPYDQRGIYILGGDDGTQLNVSAAQHQGFSKMMLRYDPRVNECSEAGELPAPRVTAPCVRWNKSWIVPSGEERPGIRSAEVWSWTPAK